MPRIGRHGNRKATFFSPRLLRADRVDARLNGAGRHSPMRFRDWPAGRADYRMATFVRGDVGSRVDLDELRASHSAVVTLAQAATVLGVDVRTVSRAVQNGELPAVRLGRRLLIPRLPLLARLGASDGLDISTPGTDGRPGPGDGTWERGVARRGQEARVVIRRREQPPEADRRPSADLSRASLGVSAPPQPRTRVAEGGSRDTSCDTARREFGCTWMHLSEVVRPI